jgi:diguanylate cyclase
MSLFDKKVAKTPSDKWEKKYFSLLDEHDALEKSTQDKEDLLCKTISRLALAATGFNHELDPFLKRIRNQLKSGLKSDKLRRELEEFSNALLTFDDPLEPSRDKESNPVQLIEFLIRQYPNRKDDFVATCQEYRNNPKATIQDLLLALHELIDEEQSVISDIQQEFDNDTVIRKQLMRLLESTEIPQHFAVQSMQLKQELQDSESSIIALLENTFSLLLQIKKHFQSEQQEMAEYLTRLSEQLNELGQQASGAAIATEKSTKKRNLLDQTVTEQMQDLRNSSAIATELDPLKQLVNSSLASIAEHIKQHNQEESNERNNHKIALQKLTEKINLLENESGELKQKLEIAHNQAIRDPLTGLPNRLAYDERLSCELARKQRYDSALSMVIWDIDFFKKINDTYGHKAGDKTLKIIAQLLEQNCRATDFISRFGGEEFVMLLPETSVQAAYTIADKLRKLIAGTGFNANNNKIAITISCGISEFNSTDTPDSAFKRADKALYEAKRKGRNQCIIAS